jgi:superfamily I DNA and/or RNA helicase
LKLKQLKGIKVSTVDAFQGGEKEIIILSCVRTESLGFIESEKRLNVALTRARRHLILVCKLDTLAKGKSYGVVINHAKSKPPKPFLTQSFRNEKFNLGRSSYFEID